MPVCLIEFHFISRTNFYFKKYVGIEEKREKLSQVLGVV